MTESDPILETRGLEKYFDQNTSLIDTLLRREDEKVQAIDGVSLALHSNESQGVIGESGCGKTTLLKTLIGLYTPTGGEIRFRGNDISEFDRSDWKEFRRNVQIIFQDPFDSLDPKLTIREALQEPLKIHNISNQEERIRNVLEQVELNPPEKYLDRFPNQMSGGELQRVSIARALILEPEVILADEPVSMLDVSTQASILNLLSELTEDLDVSMFYISHDLSTVSYVCDRINVMYLGRIVESAPTTQLLDDPQHPYSQALIDAVPIPDPNYGRGYTSLEGDVQNPVGIGEGCRFRERCPERMDICEKTPEFIDMESMDAHQVACHLHYDHPTDEGTEDENTDEIRAKTEVST